MHSEDIYNGRHYKEKKQGIMQGAPKRERTFMQTELYDSAQIPKPLGDVVMYAPLQLFALLYGDS